MAGEVFIFGAGGNGGGGGAGLNFKFIGGTARPTTASENAIWVNTDVDITSWAFSVTEPDVYDFKCDKLNGGADDAHGILVPFQLKEGDIINFTIPVTTTGVFEAVRLKDCIGKQYCIRQEDGTAVSTWTAGTKIGVRISNTAHQIGSWGNDGSAYLIKWGSYYHEDGMVWISTGASSPAEFNALKKNGIQVYPISAKQYVSGALVDIEGQIYQSGEWKVWIDWSKYIVKDGIYKLPMVAAGVPYDPSYPKTTFTVTQEDGYILFAQTTGTGMVLWGPVDLTDVNTLTIEGDFSGADGANSSQFRLGVWGQFPPTQINTWGASVLLTKTGATLDVSSIQGERYVGFSVRNVGSEKVTNFYAE